MPVLRIVRTLLRRPGLVEAHRGKPVCAGDASRAPGARGLDTLMGEGFQQTPLKDRRHALPRAGATAARRGRTGTPLVSHARSSVPAGPCPDLQRAASGPWRRRSNQATWKMRWDGIREKGQPETSRK